MFPFTKDSSSVFCTSPLFFQSRMDWSCSPKFSHRTVKEWILSQASFTEPLFTRIIGAKLFMALVERGIKCFRCWVSVRTIWLMLWINFPKPQLVGPCRPAAFLSVSSRAAGFMIYPNVTSVIQLTFFGSAGPNHVTCTLSSHFGYFSFPFLE